MTGDHRADRLAVPSWIGRRHLARSSSDIPPLYESPAAWRCVRRGVSLASSSCGRSRRSTRAVPREAMARGGQPLTLLLPRAPRRKCSRCFARTRRISPGLRFTGGDGSSVDVSTRRGGGERLPTSPTCGSIWLCSSDSAGRTGSRWLRTCARPRTSSGAVLTARIGRKTCSKEFAAGADDYLRSRPISPYHALIGPAGRTRGCAVRRTASRSPEDNRSKLELRVKDRTFR